MQNVVVSIRRQSSMCTRPICFCLLILGFFPPFPFFTLFGIQLESWKEIECVRLQACNSYVLSIKSLWFIFLNANTQSMSLALMHSSHVYIQNMTLHRTIGHPPFVSIIFLSTFYSTVVNLFRKWFRPKIYLPSFRIWMDNKNIAFKLGINLHTLDVMPPMLRENPFFFVLKSS